MNTEQDGIKTDLRAHPDIFRDGNPENTDDSNLVNDHGATSRIRSNSGSIFESTNIMSEQQQTMWMSQSYGGGRSSSFLMRKAELSPASRYYR